MNSVTGLLSDNLNCKSFGENGYLDIFGLIAFTWEFYSMAYLLTI